MNLVDEEQSPLPGLPARPRRIEYLLQIGNAGKDRRYLLEVKLCRAGQQPRHGRLAGAGRPPENERAERARLQHAGQYTVRAEQVILADDVGKRAGTKLIGQRPRRVAFEARGREKGRLLVWGARVIYR